MVFSALMWRRFHGPLTLFADSRTVDFLGDRGLLDLYHDVRSAEVDRIDLRRYRPDLYFSLPKLVALRASTVPVAVLDMDLFIRRPLPPVGPNGFVFAHYELLTSESYPTLAELPNPNRINFPGWDEQLLACNMAVAAFGNQRHLDDFTALAFGFIADNNQDAPIFKWSRIMFAEQRLVAYTARRNGVEMTPVAPSAWNTGRSKWTGRDPDPVFHHTWHRKRLFEGHQPLRDRYGVRMARELIAQFPEAQDLLGGDPVASRYVAEARAAASRGERPSRWRRRATR